MSGFEAVTLATGRLTLRPPAVGDAAEMAAAIDDEVRRWMAWSEGFTEERARRWCTREAFADPLREVNLVVEPRETGRFAGVISMYRADWEIGVVETGYWVGPGARARGYVTEALRAIAAHAFERGMHRIELLAATGNVPSQRVAERAGFTREAVLRQARPMPGGRRSDMVLFSLLWGEL